jgi:hypothetical protein
MGLMGLTALGLGTYASKISKHARVVVEWSTASEFDTVGFNLLRSETTTDPGKLVNDNLIPASDDSQTGGDYRYTDSTVVPGRVYYYYLEDVSADGSINKHGPVEVKAQVDGKIEWFLTIALATVTIFGTMTLIWPRRVMR